ncbi:lipid II flippase Amj family protein [Paenibacillus sp. 2TAB19]|uniref:lipid II flippase Amj family protein n=1 Tax=Paenibacillus sp. 2TAB19 TaxID=3233003 RepID=UPI003F967A2C
MVHSLIFVVILTIIIHAAETLSYSVRYAGVKMNKIAVALSLTGIIVLISRTANMLQSPMTGKFVDHARADASFDLLGYFRIVLFAASIGTLIAIALFPTFVPLCGRIIARLELTGSIPKLLSSVTLGQLKNAKRYIRRPRIRLKSFRYLGIPKRFIFLNIAVTAFYTVGVISALYAAHLAPAISTTASQTSGIINGIATVLLTIFIDPQLGLIMDKATKDEDARNQLGKIYTLLMVSRFFGTLLAQLLIIPAAYVIIAFVKLI